MSRRTEQTTPGVVGRRTAALELTAIVIAISAEALGVIRVPTFTIPLLLVGWVSLRARRLRWRDLGLSSPPTGWTRTVWLAALIATIHQLVSTFVLIPALENATGRSIDLSLVDPIEGNIGMLAIGVVVAWALAGFGEELVYRGYLLNRFADLIERHRWVFALIVTSVLFSVAHRYQGVIGVIDSLVSGLIWGALYLRTRRNLWLPVMAHGFFDTIAFVLAYFGVI